ncbi:DUF1801 domain-containing protein [Sneathiella marina]|uniref:DUF1801 domain-containing protein n=1 Tax=Sneathiella marina TaxID=2950108 RepID=A0ABY4W203_9PROT|nr:DUF1801 domain-containing protein [Sneathiella marina]USG61191.1 DUF1801 domain-containing protein [Sneathiella marina]
MKHFDIEDLSVAAAFKAFPKPIRSKLLGLRQLILEAASRTEGVGEIEETLKWGVPSYLTSKSRSGTTIRLAPSGNEEEYGLYVHCQTSLVKDFKKSHPKAFRYSGSRALLFASTDDFEKEVLEEFIVAALTYHQRKKTSKKPS